MTGRNERLLQSLGLKLTEEQRAVVLDPRLRPGVVIAGAGSGKTTVMAARMALLAMDERLGPERILGLTFTRKAAAELQSRVARYLASARRDGLLAAESGEVTVSTYHSFAQNFVRDYGVWAGVDPALRIETDFALLPLLFSVVTRTRALADADPSLTAAGVVAKVRKLDAALAEHAVATSRLRSHEAIRVAALGDEASLTADLAKVVAAARERAALATMVDEFRAAKAQSGVMDFSDMMRLMHQTAIGSDEPVRRIRERFGAVLLDEYQDTSVVQRTVLQRLFGEGHPVLAVGDPKQAIYGFRGAAQGNIEAFPQHFPRADGVPADVYTLRSNFRSGPTIVAIANGSAAAQAAASIAGHPPMETGADRQDAVTVRVFESQPEEAAFVIQTVKDELAEGRDPEQILVLARANREVGEYAMGLEAAGIAAASSVDAGLFDVPVVGDVLAMLTAATDPSANDQLTRLLVGPRWRIGVRDLALLGARARELVRIPQEPAAPESGAADWRATLRQATAGSDPVDAASLRDALDDPGEAPYSVAARSRFAALSGELGDLARQAGDPVVDLVARCVWLSGLDVESRLTPTAERDCAAVDALLDVAGQHHAAEPESGVQGFLRAVRLARQAERQPDFRAPELTGCVRVMTVHKAKGLEADVVLVPGMHAGGFDETTLQQHWTASGEALPDDLRGDITTAELIAPRSNKARSALRAEAKERLSAEQDRLVYVALTRARERLVVSAHIWHPNVKRPRRPSAHLLRVGGADGVDWLPGHDVADGTPNPLMGAPATAAFPQWQPEHTAWLAECAQLVRDYAGAAAELAPDADDGDSGLAAGWDEDLAALLREREARASDVTVVSVPDIIGTADLQRLLADPDGYAVARRRPMPRRPSRAAAIGTRFHDWVAQRWGQLPLLDDPEAAAGPHLDAAGEAELRALQEAFESSEYAHRTPVAIEYPFATTIAGQPTSGRIDAVYRTPEGWEVVDWKTNRATTADELQLAVYRLAWAHLNGIPPEEVTAAFFYVRRGDRVVPTPLPDEARLGAMLAVSTSGRAGHGESA